MVNHYYISVINQSGTEQNYAIFSEPPIVTGSFLGPLRTYILDSMETPSHNSATFNIYPQYYAVCSHSNGSAGDNVSATEKGSTPVTLGTKTSDGALVPGTTLSMRVEKGAPFFSEANNPPNSASVGAFEIDTGTDFTAADAQQGNFGIGLGGSGNGPSTALFTPLPNVRYQIQPVNVFYICYGNYQTGAVVDTSQLGPFVKVDFSTGPNVTILHNDRGVLVVQQN